MSTSSLIIGESGTGKSTSIRTLDPKETFIINVINKPLPFRGYKNMYSVVSPDGLTGNYYSSDNYEYITKVIKKINAIRPDIKNLVIDDFQYLLSNEFMSRALERGFDKFTEIGKHAHEIIALLPTLREDLDCFVLSHSEPNEHGKMKIKTIGKILDEKVCLEGRFTVVLQTELHDGRYEFITQGDTRHIAKSPMGMFESKNIPNDLSFVKAKMSSYYNEDIAI
jgi:hypothetical protein